MFLRQNFSALLFYHAKVFLSTPNLFFVEINKKSLHFLVKATVSCGRQCLHPLIGACAGKRFYFTTRWHSAQLEMTCHPERSRSLCSEVYRTEQTKACRVRYAAGIYERLPVSSTAIVAFCVVQRRTRTDKYNIWFGKPPRLVTRSRSCKHSRFCSLAVASKTDKYSMFYINVNILLSISFFGSGASRSQKFDFAQDDI